MTKTCLIFDCRGTRVKSKRGRRCKHHSEKLCVQPGTQTHVLLSRPELHITCWWCHGWQWLPEICLRSAEGDALQVGGSRCDNDHITHPLPLFLSPSPWSLVVSPLAHVARLSPLQHQRQSSNQSSFLWAPWCHLSKAGIIMCFMN